MLTHLSSKASITIDKPDFKINNKGLKYWPVKNISNCCFNWWVFSTIEFMFEIWNPYWHFQKVYIIKLKHILWNNEKIYRPAYCILVMKFNNISIILKWKTMKKIKI